MAADREPNPQQEGKQEDLELPEDVAEDVKGGATGWKKPSSKLHDKT